MKKVFLTIITVFLVVAFATTGVFATSLPSSFSDLYSNVLFGGSFSNGTFSPSGSNSRVYFNVSDLVPGTTYYILGHYTVSNFSGSNLSVALVPSGTNNNTSYLGSTIQGTNVTISGTGDYDVNGSFVYDSSYPYITLAFGRSGASINFDGVFLSSTPSLATESTFSIVLPYGNALSITSESSFTITSRAYTIHDATYNYQKYVRATDDFSYRVNGAYQGVVSASSLTGNFGLGVYNSNNVLDLLIPWQPTNQNVLGRATDYNFYAGLASENVFISAGNAFLLWYPYYANNQDTSKLNEVPMQISLEISYSSPLLFTTYPITGSTSSAGEDTYISNSASSSDSGGSSQTDDGSGGITVSFDNAPTAGGNHGQAPINSNNSILGVLSNLQNTLLGLFNKAIDGIHNLISMGSSFLQSVQIMFSWLPGELLVIITSGFVILLTIGVLKTLWR